MMDLRLYTVVYFMYTRLHSFLSPSATNLASLVTSIFTSKMICYPINLESSDGLFTVSSSYRSNVALSNSLAKSFHHMMLLLSSSNILHSPKLLDISIPNLILFLTYFLQLSLCLLRPSFLEYDVPTIYMLFDMVSNV